MARKIPVLGRILGAPALYSLAYGEIGSSLYYALGITAVYSLALTPVVFLVAGAIFALAAAAYAEGGATIPESGGASAFARRAFNDLVGFVAGWATILDYVIAISLSALFLPHYVLGAFGQDTLTESQTTAAAVAIVAGVTVARVVRRTDVYALGVVASVLDLLVQVGLAVFGLMLLFNWSALTNQIDLGTRPTWDSLAFALPIAMIGFTGLEKVTSLAGMAKNPEKTIPDSVRTSVFTVIIVYAAVSVAAISAFPTHPAPDAPAGYASGLTTTWLDAPMLGLATAVGQQLGGSVVVHAIRLVVGLAATLILLLAITTSFSGAARLSVGMGDRLQLPPMFARRSRRSLQPVAALVGIGALACSFLVVASFFEGEEILSLASIYSFGILIAFALANASIVWLRISEPDMPRPFMMHGNVRIGGRLVPVTAVLGALAAFLAWVIALGTHPGARDVGVIWMISGCALYAMVRIRAGVPLMSRYDPGAPPPEDVISLPSGPIVVPLEEPGAIADEVMAIACRLAVETGGPVVAVTAIVIPVREQLDMPAPVRGQAASEVQEMARALAESYGVEFFSKIERTRSAGRTIVDTVHEYGAGLIVIGSPAKRRVARTREEAFFGHTVDFVLRKAPCRVIVTHFPAESAGGESPHAALAEGGERRLPRLSRVRARESSPGSTG
jgi:basic amino acid/polyamine antiporter, APA family